MLPILGGALADRYGYRRMLHGGVLAPGDRLLRGRLHVDLRAGVPRRCW
ncbi:MAG: hypothetical protein MZV64_43465 [Ignavibacteriales bacterium]|nr:hypothetical protein [Ignavibacteriales bacterium]